MTRFYAPETGAGGGAEPPVSVFNAPPAAAPPAAAPPAAAPPAAAPPAAAPPAGGEQAGWFTKLSPEERAWAESKGWKADTDPLAILQSYQNLEKVFGADKAGRTVVLPKDENDKAALDAIYDKLGRPKDPKDYVIELPQGADTTFADAARGWFHKAGLTSAQAKAVTENYRALELDAMQRLKSTHATEVEGVQKEWGAQYDHKVEVAKAALKAAALPEAQVKAIESAIGPAAAAKMFEFFGRNYVEAGPPGGDTRSAPGFSNLSPAAAAQKMDQLRLDQNFMARYGNPDPKIRAAAMAEMDALAKIAVNNGAL
ncbi:MAG: hypothetical protein IPM11_01200 [Micropruina sp.]|nr:hypothetical protein [Micropruina sp.]